VPLALQGNRRAEKYFLATRVTGDCHSSKGRIREGLGKYQLTVRHSGKQAVSFELNTFFNHIGPVFRYSL
jgi:hypothetical protein